MGADLRDSTAFHEGHPVGGGHRRHAVGHHHHGGGKLGEAGEDAFLERRVDRRSGVVEQDHSGLPRECPGQGHPLALAAGEGDAPLTDDGLVPVWEIVAEVSGTGDVEGLDQLVVGTVATEIGVAGDRARVEDRLLRGEGHPAAEVVVRDVGRGHATHVDRAVVHRAEPGQHLQHRGLAAGGGADDGERLAGFDLEIETGQSRPVLLADPHVTQGRRQRSGGKHFGPRCRAKRVVGLVPEGVDPAPSHHRHR